jgi:hypothetical protein
MTVDPQPKIPTFIRRVMPSASEAELHDATETFRRYVAVVMRMSARLAQESRTVDSQNPHL